MEVKLINYNKNNQISRDELIDLIYKIIDMLNEKYNINHKDFFTELFNFYTNEYYKEAPVNIIDRLELQNSNSNYNIAQFCNLVRYIDCYTQNYNQILFNKNKYEKNK